MVLLRIFRIELVDKHILLKLYILVFYILSIEIEAKKHFMLKTTRLQIFGHFCAGKVDLFFIGLESFFFVIDPEVRRQNIGFQETVLLIYIGYTVNHCLEIGKKA